MKPKKITNEDKFMSELISRGYRRREGEENSLVLARIADSLIHIEELLEKGERK